MKNLPKRDPKMTFKAIEYQRSLLLKDRNRMVNRLERKGTAINKLLSLGSITAIEEALSQYDDTIQLFQEAHKKYSKFVPMEEKDNNDAWYDTIDDEIFNVKHQAISVLRDLKLKEDSGSLYSKTSRKSKGSIGSGGSKHSTKTSSSSSKSSRSSNSSNGSVKDQMLQEHLRMAELQAEIDFLEEQYKASLQAASLKHRQEIAKSSARMKVLQQQEKSVNIKDEKSMHSKPTKTIDPAKEIKKEPVKEAKNESKKSNDCKNVLFSSYQTMNLQGNSQSKFHKVENDQSSSNESENIDNESDNLENQSNIDHNDSEEKISDSSVSSKSNSIKDNQSQVNETLCQLLKVQSAPEVDVEVFDGDPLNFNFFIF